MKKEMTLETNDEAVDLSRRSMMSRLGLVASVAIAAPVLMTMSTSVLARHKENSSDRSGGRWLRDNPNAGGGNSNAGGNNSGGDEGEGEDPPTCDSPWGCG